MPSTARRCYVMFEIMMMMMMSEKNWNLIDLLWCFLFHWNHYEVLNRSVYGILCRFFQKIFLEVRLKWWMNWVILSWDKIFDILILTWIYHLEASMNGTLSKLEGKFSDIHIFNYFYCFLVASWCKDTNIIHFRRKR